MPEHQRGRQPDPLKDTTEQKRSGEKHRPAPGQRHGLEQERGRRRRLRRFAHDRSSISPTFATDETLYAVAYGPRQAVGGSTTNEAARVALTRNMKRKGKLWIKIFPDKSVTKRPPETRMGKGKGNPEFWVATVRPGNILFELDGVTESVARESLRLAATKLPIKTRFISRQHAATA